MSEFTCGMGDGNRKCQSLGYCNRKCRSLPVEWVMATENVAFMSGSSKHGKTFLASVD